MLIRFKPRNPFPGIKSNEPQVKVERIHGMKYMDEINFRITAVVVQRALLKSIESFQLFCLDFESKSMLKAKKAGIST